MTRAPLEDYPRTVVLKDGAHLVLRPADPTPDPDAAVIVAVDGERVAGTTVLTRRGDVGVIEVRVEEPYRGRRLGMWMLLDAVHLASAFGLARLEARAEAEAAAYRAALRRLDFVEDPPGVLVKTLHASWPDF